MRIIKTALAVCLLVGAIGVAANAEPVVAVGPNVQVSASHPTEDHFEVQINADPANANNLVACSHIGMASPDMTKTGNYISTDAGLTWREARFVPASGDPACAFGLNSSVYILSLPYKGGVWVYRSPDLGKTWLGPAYAAPIDREYFTIDRTGGKFNGRIYVNGTGVIRSYDPDVPETTMATLFFSSNAGKSFSAPLFAATNQKSWILGMGNGIVLSDGTYGFIFGEWNEVGGGPATSLAPNAALKFITTSDGGKRFNRASVVTATRRTCDSGPIWGGGLIPYIAVDTSHGPFRNRIYVAYDDRSSGRCVMLVTHSSDEGKTWSDPVRVDRDIENEANPKGPEDSIPAIAVNSAGIVGLTWYDRRDDPNNFKRITRFAASADGGLSFTKPVAVSTFANSTSWRDRFLPPWSTVSKPGKGIHASISIDLDDIDSGDTGGLTADAGGTFHALWSDDRSGVSQLYTAPITVSGRAWRNGDASLASLTDISDDVQLKLTNSAFDASTGTLTADAVLTNVSKTPIRGPIKIRVLTLGSQFSDNIVTQTTDNGETQDGIIWDFSIPGGASALAPHGKTAPKHLVFVLSNLKPISNKLLEDRLVPQGLIQFDAHAFGLPVSH